MTEWEPGLSLGFNQCSMYQSYSAPERESKMILHGYNHWLSRFFVFCSYPGPNNMRDWAATVLSAKWLTIIIFTQQIRLYDNCFSQMSPHSPLFWHLFKFNAKQKLPWFGLPTFILLIYLFLSRNEIIWFMLSHVVQNWRYRCFLLVTCL